MIIKKLLTALIFCLVSFGSVFGSHAKADNIEKQCWFQDKVNFKFSDVDLIVRTINIHLPAPDYAFRLLGIAGEFKKDWPYKKAIIGMQEVEGKMTECITIDGVVNGSECLASALDGSAGSSYSISNKVGAVAGYPWDITGSSYWNVGNLFERRYLLETRLKHSEKSWKLRFYTTHLSSEENHKRDRLDQVKEITEIIKKRAEPGELPPILVGDFNAGRVFNGSTPESSVLEMEKYFYRPIDKAIAVCKESLLQETGIDIVYIGKKNVFRKSIGEFDPIRTHNIRFAGIPARVDGYPELFPELTDHHSQGFSFRIVERTITQQRKILSENTSNMKTQVSELTN